jgi:hypothetical protein
MCLFGKRRVTKIEVRSRRELEILERELNESKNHALPSNLRDAFSIPMNTKTVDLLPGDQYFPITPEEVNEALKAPKGKTR